MPRYESFHSPALSDTGWGGRPVDTLFQASDLRQNGGGFFFKRGAHGLIIGVGDFAGFQLKIQVAQILVDGFFPLSEIDEARFFRSGIDLARIEENVIEHGDCEGGADVENHWSVS